MTDLEHSVARFLGSSKRRWDNLVDTVLTLRPKQLRPGSDRLAKLSNEDPRAMWQKFRAILAAAKENPVADIKRAGQAKTLSTYQKAKNGARTDKQVILSWKVSPELREAVHQEVLRIADDINLRTSEEFWTWMLAAMRQCTKLDLRHEAGEVSIYDQVFKT